MRNARALLRLTFAQIRSVIQPELDTEGFEQQPVTGLGCTGAALHEVIAIR